MTQAVILAAGRGTRISSLSWGRPKCLLELHGKHVIEWQLQLLRACDVKGVTIVTGYRGDLIRSVVGDRARYVHYPDFAATNNLHTLQYAGSLLASDTLILFADVLVASDALKRCVQSEHAFGLLVDTSQNRPGTMRVKSATGRIHDLGAHIAPGDGNGNFVGIAKYSAAGAVALRCELDAMVREGTFRDAYYVHALVRLASAGRLVYTIPTDAAPWLEIDTEEDFRRALKEDFYVLGRHDCALAQRDGNIP